MEFSGQYLTYAEYQNLGGSLAEAPFNILEYEARKLIDKYTFGRIKNLEVRKDEVIMCDFELIGTLNAYTQSNIQNKGISSENIDGYSVTYQTITKEVIKAKNDELRDIIYTHLSDCYLENGIPYLYRGINDN